MKEALDIFVATLLYNAYWELPTDEWLRQSDAGDVLGIIVTVFNVD